MRTFLTFVVGLVLAIGLTACDSNDESPAQVRFIHASADAGVVDILVNGETVASGVSFSSLNGGVSDNPTVSDYYNVPVSSNTTIEVENSSGSVVTSTTASEARLEGGERHTVLIAGATSAQQTDSPRAIILRDRFQASLGDSKVGIRLIHGSALAGAVDVYLTPPETDLQNVDPLVSSFQFTEDFPGNFAGQFAPQAVSQDGSVISITKAGSKEAVFQLQVGGDQGLQVSPGQYITGVAIDNPDDDLPEGALPVGALVHVDSPGE